MSQNSTSTSTSALAKRTCVYTNGGRRKEHWDGAKKHFKPVITVVEGPGGELVRKKSRKEYSVCDVEPAGGRLIRKKPKHSVRRPRVMMLTLIVIKFCYVYRGVGWGEHRCKEYDRGK